jgi:ornithine cyclodeaminase/alanine dehydrogenase-like protein (mu-crystallin family)
MRFIDADTTRRHLGAANLIGALRQMFIEGCELPLRHTHTVGEGTLLLMPAWRTGQRLGLKTVTIFPGNTAHGQPGLHSTYLLFDAATGVPLAQLDGNEITSRRTAAASALAASFLARADAGRLLVVGSGRVASLITEAMQVVRPLTEVVVWNHRAASAEALAGRLREQGFNARASTDLAGAVAAADIVSCATLSTDALIRGEWLQPGTHLDLIGSFTPAMCEADAACFQRSRVYVDTLEALAKSGDVLRAVAAGAFNQDQVAGTLAELCRGNRPGRSNAAQITLFKAVGSALEDLAAAELVWGGVQADSLSLAPAPVTDRAP